MIVVTLPSPLLKLLLSIIFEGTSTVITNLSTDWILSAGTLTAGMLFGYIADTSGLIITFDVPIYAKILVKHKIGRFSFVLFLHALLWSVVQSD